MTLRKKREGRSVRAAFFFPLPTGSGGLAQRLARLQMGEDSVATGYPPAALDAWAQRVRAWASGHEPDDLPRVEPDKHASVSPREVFVYFIHEGKVRAPAAAMALIERLGQA